MVRHAAREAKPLQSEGRTALVALPSSLTDAKHPSLLKEDAGANALYHHGDVLLDNLFIFQKLQ